MNGRICTHAAVTAALFLGLVALGTHPLSAAPFIIDLTHATPTFQALDGDPNKPDLSKPHGESIPIPSFGPQAVLQHPKQFFTTNQGFFYAGRLSISEHHGTHIDAPYHFANKRETLEGKKPVRKFVHELSTKDLVGPAVLIDISGRVQSELDKNGGKPSPDTKVTDFSEASPNNVTAGDIQAVAGKLKKGVWIVVNLGWSRFYFDANWATTPYFNGFNFPGLNKGAVDKIIEIENKGKFRINGIIIDNIGIDSGESSKGTDDKFSNSFYSHVRGLQRGWKFVENATNIGQLAKAKRDSCTMVLGAPKHISGSGGQTRVIALCEK